MGAKEGSRSRATEISSFFKKKLCDCLGPSTRAFPGWNAEQPADTVDEIAIDLYTLRSELAHGVDLRKQPRIQSFRSTSLRSERYRTHRTQCHTLGFSAKRPAICSVKSYRKRSRTRPSAHRSPPTPTLNHKNTPRPAPHGSADRGDRKLLTDLSRQAIVDLGVTRDRSFCAIGRIGIYRVATAFSIQMATLLLQVTDQFMPFQARGAPT